ncbi:hypothetical protein [Mycolicibacterium sp.]|uniref:hypothetical protein n=1 Tax=Mycolicibacterium sp. TaxID=2320850 RepID=UPI003D1163BC
MHGPHILARFLEVPGAPDKYGNAWQYNSRSDRHSKVGCWGVAFDLLVASSGLRAHAADGKVVLGVNHSMTDFATGRRKKLDLVIARPAAPVGSPRRTFKKLADEYGIVLTEAEAAQLAELPDLPVAAVGAVLIALEAKATMTAHVKSLPRLYDELNSSHLCVHGASSSALAIGYVQVNNSATFVSSVMNNHSLAGNPVIWSQHRQPDDTLRVIEKVKEIPRRSKSSEVGFDGIGLSVLDFRNDGGPVSIVSAPPAPQQGDSFHYESMIVRMANEYDAVFGKI